MFVRLVLTSISKMLYAYSMIESDLQRGCQCHDIRTVISKPDHGDSKYDDEEETFTQATLLYACRKGHVKIALGLLERGASVKKASLERRTATIMDGLVLQIRSWLYQ